jgi:hypothetical protein
MMRSHSSGAMRIERRRSGDVRFTPTVAKNVRYAEDLAEVDSAVSRAALLLRPSVKKAA